MTDKIYAGVDTGNGKTAVAARLPNGKTVLHVIPSVRAEATGLTLGSDVAEVDYTYLDWLTKGVWVRYVVGNDVIRISDRNLERHLGANRYGGHLHQFLTFAALALAGVKGGAVDLCLFAPPGFYKEAKPAIEQAFLKQSFSIKLKGKPEYKFYVQDVTVLAEGSPISNLFVLDQDGAFREDADVAGRFVFIDGGYHTLDVVEMLDGEMNPERLNTTEGGINTLVIEPILDDVRRYGGEFRSVTPEHIDSVLRDGMDKGNWNLRWGGHQVDLQNHFAARADIYFEWVCANILDSRYRGLDGVRYVVPIGGYALLTGDRTRQRYGKKVIGLPKAVKGMTALHANAVGGLLQLLSYEM